MENLITFRCEHSALSSDFLMLEFGICCRGVDETFNRKMKLAQEKNLIYEEGKKSSEISVSKPKRLAVVSGMKRSG